MTDGIYSITYEGQAGTGLGMLHFSKGQIVGAGYGGGDYDGSYVEDGSELVFDVVMTVPPGVPLVQGTPAMPHSYKLPLQGRLPVNFGQEQPITVPTPAGPVKVVFKKLRSI